MQLGPKSNAVGTQEQCSWSMKAMQLACENIAEEKLKKCYKKTEFMPLKTHYFRLIKRL